MRMIHWEVTQITGDDLRHSDNSIKEGSLIPAILINQMRCT
ncbi:hypothetical protein KC19_6G102400 [Ceratodon purpureus]|uniref:Uncharacterized protein n=1 Tax=Ceratodon purpureus TaxID=3225 RepID=A0A8T0HGI1_CERPU|nr:hypothetical protein KC19_6G102400 [Ceratodon purpureus]